MAVQILGQNVPNLGQKKRTIEDLPVFCEQEWQALEQGIEGLLQQGTPLEVPVGIPLEQVGRIIRTLREYRAIAKDLAEAVVGTDSETAIDVAKRAQALLDIPAPTAPRVIVPPGV